MSLEENKAIAQWRIGIGDRLHHFGSTHRRVSSAEDALRTPDTSAKVDAPIEFLFVIKTALCLVLGCATSSSFSSGRCGF